MDPTTTDTGAVPIPDRIGRYRIDEKLGEEAYGTVYRAYDEDDRRRVSLRMLPEPVRLDAQRRARALEDLRGAMDLDHPNLAVVLDAGEGPRGVYAVSDFVAGLSLRQRLEDAGRLDLAEALRITEEIASAVAVLHRHGQVHGMLGDDRIILQDDGRPKVTGLGLAELARPSMRRPIDARTDVYAIGALLYEMLSGTRIATREGATDPPERPAPIEASVPNVPAKLSALLTRCLDPDPDRRPKDADVLLAALTDVDLPVEPVGQQMAEGRAVAQAGATWAWVVGASVVIVAVVAVALAFLLWAQGR